RARISARSVRVQPLDARRIEVAVDTQAGPDRVLDGHRSRERRHRHLLFLGMRARSAASLIKSMSGVTRSHKASECAPCGARVPTPPAWRSPRSRAADRKGVSRGL